MKSIVLLVFVALLAQGCTSSPTQSASSSKLANPSRKPAAVQFDRPVNCTRISPPAAAYEQGPKNGIYSFRVDMAGRPQLAFINARGAPLDGMVTPCEFIDGFAEYAMVLNCLGSDREDPHTYWYFKNELTKATQNGVNYNCVSR